MVEALLTLKGDNAPAIGRERIRLLEAVSREGSIAAGARSIGLTYRTAWNTLDAMTRLFGCAVIEARVGGRAGGGARLTPAGLRLVETFGRLEAELARAARRVEEIVRGEGAAGADEGPALRTSARNAFRGTVAALRREALTAEVAVALPEQRTVLARVTDGSLQSLGLCEGRAIVALVKASFVDLAVAGTAHDAGFANRFDATVRHCRIAGADAEVVLDLGHGRTLAATGTARRLRALDLAPGRPVLARFHAAQVILAIP